LSSHCGFSPHFSRKRSLPASPSENIVFNKEQLYTSTYHYNKKQNLNLLWKWGARHVFIVVTC
jgi:hypothetical protein